MNPVISTLERLVDKLERAGLDYMVVGSLASSHHGEPRSTQDADVVIAADPEALERLLALLPSEDWYVDANTARMALASKRQFNIIDQRQIWKVDLIVCKGTAFEEEAFSRRTLQRLGTVDAYVQSAEDTVLSKLRWAHQVGGSERQLRDVSGILAIQQELDWEYLHAWAEELGVAEMLE